MKFRKSDISADIFNVCKLRGNYLSLKKRKFCLYLPRFVVYCLFQLIELFSSLKSLYLSFIFTSWILYGWFEIKYWDRKVETLLKIKIHLKSGSRNGGCSVTVLKMKEISQHIHVYISCLTFPLIILYFTITVGGSSNLMWRTLLWIAFRKYLFLSVLFFFFRYWWTKIMKAKNRRKSKQELIFFI